MKVICWQQGKKRIETVQCRKFTHKLEHENGERHGHKFEHGHKLEHRQGHGHGHRKPEQTLDKNWEHLKR